MLYNACKMLNDTTYNRMIYHSEAFRLGSRDWLLVETTSMSVCSVKCLYVCLFVCMYVSLLHAFLSRLYISSVQTFWLFSCMSRTEAYSNSKKLMQGQGQGHQKTLKPLKLDFCWSINGSNSQFHTHILDIGGHQLLIGICIRPWPSWLAPKVEVDLTIDLHEIKY